MKKTLANRIKDHERTKDKIWIPEPQTGANRKCASGVTFGGRYVDVGKEVKP